MQEASCNVAVTTMATCEPKLRREFNWPGWLVGLVGWLASATSATTRQGPQTHQLYVMLTCIATTAIIDHVAAAADVDAILKHDGIGGSKGGSRRVDLPIIHQLLGHLASFSSAAAGSVTNVARNCRQLQLTTRLVRSSLACHKNYMQAMQGLDS